MSTTPNVGSTAQVRGLIFSLFGILSLLANAVLTAMFGYTFLAGAFGAFLLLLFFDAAAIAWYVVRLDSGLSGAQRAAAKLMSVSTIVGSTLVSVVQVLTVSGVMETSGWISTAAVWLVTGYGAANFFGIFFFQNASVKERKTEQREELAAQKADKLQEMTTEAYNKAMNEATALLLARTPAIAKRLALQAEKEYLRDLDMMDMLEVATAQPMQIAEVKQPIVLGAAAGAKKVVKKPAPTPSAAANPDCACGLPIGTSAGECDFELGGQDCALDVLAAKQKAEREAQQLADVADMEPLDLTATGK